MEGVHLTDQGMLVDFSWVKEVVGEWIDQNWDHACLLFCDDPLVKMLCPDGTDYWDKRVFCFNANPTAEVMAGHLYRVIENRIPSSYYAGVRKVRIYETPTSFAEFEV